MNISNGMLSPLDALEVPSICVQDLDDPCMQGIYLEVPLLSRRRRSRQISVSTEPTSPDVPDPLPSDPLQPDFASLQDEDVFTSPRLFTELMALSELDGKDSAWKEAARWVRFEEDVEEGGERWSKPRVSTLSVHSFFETRSLILKGNVLLDIEGSSLDEILHSALNKISTKENIPTHKINKIKDTIKRKTIHLYELSKNKENGTMSNRFSIFRKKIRDKTVSNIEQNVDEDADYKGNTHFLKKLPEGAEAGNILVGEVKYLDKPLCLLLRLKNAVNLGTLTEVPIATRFIFILLGPVGGLASYCEVGRTIATLFSDEVFREVAYEAQEKSFLLAGIDEFLDASTILPPGEWDPTIRIEPPESAPTKAMRTKKAKDEEDEVAQERKMREEAGLTRTGRLFGGLINDVKRKIPWYLSDFKDGISLQTLATFFFLYFACLTPIVTFGGLLGDATNDNIAVMESLIAGLICGVVYGLFSGQPLTIIGSTGPVLVFETIMYEGCDQVGWNYLSFRLWVGLWAALILIFLVAVDASALVCYITRFTEENFATLIAFIFIFKAIEKVLNIGRSYPMETNVPVDQFGNCTFEGDIYSSMVPSNFSEEECKNTIQRVFNTGRDYPMQMNVDGTKFCNCTFEDDVYPNMVPSNLLEEECKNLNGTLVGSTCSSYVPDVFLLSLILFLGTFFISMQLKNFKTASFFPAKVRAYISAFSVIIAIMVMTAIDMAIGIGTPKLAVPSQFKPTSPDRGWIIHPFNGNPWWTAILAVVPAVLACILIFMDQQITAVIINRKEHKLKKGCGYHLDLFVLSLLIAFNSIMGLPWFVAATVLSINHVNSLYLESECSAPGEQPQFLGVRENRLTHVMIFLSIGMSVFLTDILSCIPKPVLFGVFLYMGISALNGIQFFERILIMFMPLKYQPDRSFLRQVRLRRVHLFTFIQMTCLAVLWVIKSFKMSSILFPLMLVFMIGVRKLLDNIFTQRELKILDDILPEFSRKEKLVDSEEEEKQDEEIRTTIKKDRSHSIFLAAGGVINLSEDFPSRNLSLSERTSQTLYSTGSSRRNSNASSRTIRRGSILEPIFGAQHFYQAGDTMLRVPSQADFLPNRKKTSSVSEPEDDTNNY